MLQAISIFKIILQLLAIIGPAIKAAEELLPQSGQGAAKLDLVRSWIETAYTAGGQVEIAFEQVWPMAQGVISGIVKAFNQSGTFSK